MDPATSCAAPGCSDPYTHAPITWSFKDSDKDRDPHFVRRTHSYMPVCDAAASDGTCAGTTPTTFTGQGLEFTRARIKAYRGSSAPFPQTNETRYVNILITDGQTSDGSSSVQAALRGLLDDGIKTYVIGFGTSMELDQAQLDQYAAWGDTGKAIVVDPSRPESADQLASALTGVVSSLGIDACCVLNQCATEPEPADPHPVCGDGKTEGSEVCDDGPLNASYGHCSARCDGQHLFCGDGRKDGPEECDDGNRVDRDGCTNGCRSMPEDADAGPANGESPVSRVGGVPAGTTRSRTAPVAPAVGVSTLPPTAGAGQVLPAPDAGVAGLAAAPAVANKGCGCNLSATGQPRYTLALAFCTLVLLRLRLRRSRR
jgi:cysteine-rich repeat protein